MGLSLKVNLFRSVSPQAVYGALAEFYAGTGAPLTSVEGEGEDLILHETAGDWTVLELGRGWERRNRSLAQLHVSRRLSCSGLLVFVCDGDYWGYELFDDGEVVDRFSQWETEGVARGWFPEGGLTGSASVLARCIGIPEVELAPYLVQDPAFTWDAEQTERDALAESDARVRPGDQYTRFNECAVVDFLRLLGVPVDVQEGHVVFQAPVYRSVRKREHDVR